jgi:cation transport ATPase
MDDPSQLRPEKTTQLTRSSVQELRLREIIAEASWPDAKVTFSTEPSDERASRLRREEAEQAARLTREEEEARFKRSQEEAETRSKRQREGVAFVAGLCLMVILFGVCLWVVLSKNFTTETEKWATTALASILGAVLGAFSGYTYGKGSGK